MASSAAKLTKEELLSIVEQIKVKITKDGCWDNEMTANMASITSNDSLYTTIYSQFTNDFVANETKTIF